jgi:hypothetical protein
LASSNQELQERKTCKSNEARERLPGLRPGASQKGVIVEW